MTDMNSGSATEVAQPVNQQQSIESTPQNSSEQTSVQTEKYLSQSEVGKIAGASRKEGHDKGYEKGYHEALAKFQQQQQPSALHPQPSPAPADHGNISDLVARQVTETLRKEREDYQRQILEQRENDELTRLASELTPKLNAAKERYDDYQAAVESLHVDKMRNARDFLQQINSVPNAGDVLYDLAKNPQKMGILNSLHAPELVMQQIHALSQSLQNNQISQEKKIAREPLSIVEPSNVGKSTGAPTGQQIVEAAKNKYRF
jgi:hypothetical protein